MRTAKIGPDVRLEGVKQPTFRDATTGFPRNDVLGTSTEIPY